jgi:hypothetical protein
LLIVHDFYDFAVMGVVVVVGVVYVARLGQREKLVQNFVL